VELRQLNYFACLYREGTMTRAAQRLNIVQPALSTQIAKLESEFGQTLFERTPKGMVPTEAGTRAFELFAPLLDQLVQARQSVADARSDVTGQIRIGLVASATNAALVDTLAHFVQHHPNIQIYVTLGFSVELIDKLRNQELDTIVINQTFGDEGFDSREILDEDLVLAAGAQTVLDIEVPVPLYSLGALNLVLPSRRHGLRRAIEDVVRAHTIELEPHLEIDDASVIEGLIRQTNYVSILPASMVNRGLLAGALRAYPLAPPGMSRRMICLHDPARPGTPMETAFIDMLAEKLRALEEATTTLAFAHLENQHETA
jgi:LysR family transcriptional regulator, nitrogen assimilation regulatory protein